MCVCCNGEIPYTARSQTHGITWSLWVFWLVTWVKPRKFSAASVLDVVPRVWPGISPGYSLNVFLPLFACWFRRKKPQTLYVLWPFFEVATGSRLAMTSRRNTDSGDACSLKKKQLTLKWGSNYRCVWLTNGPLLMLGCVWTEIEACYGIELISCRKAN